MAGQWKLIEDETHKDKYCPYCLKNEIVAIGINDIYVCSCNKIIDVTEILSLKDVREKN